MAVVVNRFVQHERVGGVEKCFGDYLQCIAKLKAVKTNHPLWQDQEEPRSILQDQAEKRLLNVYYEAGNAPIRKFMGESSSGGGGGYLVPTEYAYGLMHDVAEDAIFWKRSYVQRMTSKMLELSLPDPTKSIGTSQVTNFLGGIQMKWQLPPEQTANETEPSFRDVELVAWGLSGVAYSSNELVQDYAGLDDFLRRIFVRSVAWFTDQAFLQGQGPPGAPLGVLNAPGTILNARQTAGTVTQQDLAVMMQQLLPASWVRAVWCISPGAMNKIMNLTGLGGILYFIPGEDGSVGMLFGRPMYITEKLPEVGTTGDVTLLDPSMYIVGHRDLLIDYSDQDPAAFPYNKSAWRIIWRGDGTPALESSMTLANQSSTKVAPMVCLQ
jgi:HK97 family phage major capsid protein